jgi:hypothetical protein
MELKSSGADRFINGLGHLVILPVGRFVFPLIKSSDIKTDEITDTIKFVIVTQRRINADTSIIEQQEKVVWEYLLRYDYLLSARKSIIYKNSPKFSIFGVGEYSFSKYKVAISGFYKEAQFALITGENPIMLDDTCYFLSFDNIVDAIITVSLLNSNNCKYFLKSIVFLDSKRPYTKDILKRIDILKLLESTTFQYIYDYAKNIKGKYYITQDQYFAYISKLKSKLTLNKKNNRLF